ncbi:MAG: hypothetical protein D6785_03655 [Planctomycetota bacterium]|nr:MAG: hypothetical protein D6785_03655 [Planctomycetota bacterium]
MNILGEKTMKKLCLVALFLTSLFFIGGCFTLNMNHNRRHIESIRDDLHELHQDFDLIVFDLEPMPSE